MNGANRNNFAGLLVAIILFVNPVLAQNDCSAVIVSSTYQPESSKVELWDYTAGRLGLAQLVYQSSNENSGAVAAQREEGKVVVAWIENSNSSSSLNLRIRDKFGEWGDVVSLVETSSEISSLTALYDGSETVYLAWASAQDGDDDIYLSRLTSNTWTSSESINNSNAVPDILPRLRFQHDGRPVMTWRAFDMGSLRYQLMQKIVGEALDRDTLSAARENNCKEKLSGMTLPNTVSPFFINYPQDILNSYQTPLDQ